ncbi:MAG: APC family permease [Rhodospirillales bacterium]|nr:APC family permease [Acetobacter sp.]
MDRKQSTGSHGLRHASLSGLEALAQSISSVAPTAGPAILVPLVFALAGNGAWLSFLLATIAVFVVALNISSFASYSASPGSLYAYTTSVFTGKGGELSAWSLLLAYAATAAAVTGGFVNYAGIVVTTLVGKSVPPLALATLCLAIAIYVAWRDVKISARLMLWFEAVSVALILLVVLLTLWKAGPHLDRKQWNLEGATGSGVRLGLVLAIFSFVGFESATTLGDEAKNPLRNIPKAVLGSAVLAGAFFILCAYTEVLGFGMAHIDLSQNTAPMHVLAAVAGLPALAPVIDIGAAISFFACALSCITAGARVVLVMAHRGLAPNQLTRVHAGNDTPHFAVVLVGIAAWVLTAALLIQGVTGADVNGYMGTFATYGFITAYAIVSVALPVHLHRHGHLRMKAIVTSTIAVLAMLAALVGSLIPVPPPPTNTFIWIFAAYLTAGFVWSLTRSKRNSNYV